MRVLFVLGLLLWSSTAPAQMIGNRAVVMLNPQVRPDNASAGLPAVDDNWAMAGYPYAGGACAEWGHRVPCYLHQSTTRASTAYCTTLDGLLFNVATGILRQCAWNGALIEETRTNIALWARDYTNAVWVKVNVTAALTATGADSIANTASLLTATAANGTILQTVTAASSQRALSVYVQRVTGSGAINFSQDGVAWTALTSANCVLPGSGAASALVTTGYVKCTLVATQLNPVIGFQIAANGDAINADFTGLEAGAFSTSAIPTTTVSVTRAADVTLLTGAANTLMSTGIFSAVIADGGVSQTNLALLTGNTDTSLMIGTSSTIIRSVISATTLSATLGSGTVAGATKNGISFNAAGRSLVANNGTLTSDAVATGANTSFALGGRTAGTAQSDGFYTRNTIFGTRISDATLKAMTIP